MQRTERTTMRAIALDRFGGIETLALQEIPVPPVGRGEILIRIEAAGVGEWDAFEREGGYAEMLDMRPTFPYVLGSEGAGTIVAVGGGVRHVKEGDRVYACGFLNPKGGFYAEYAVIDAGYAAPIPGGLTTVQQPSWRASASRRCVVWMTRSRSRGARR
jgi:NADPH:quinone reductase-like Zn-dependent oxidoreductase